MYLEILVTRSKQNLEITKIFTNVTKVTEAYSVRHLLAHGIQINTHPLLLRNTRCMRQKNVLLHLSLVIRV